MTTQQGDEARLLRLLGFRDQDKGNMALAVDCAEAALATRRITLAREILEPFEESATLDARGRNIAALAAMQDGDHARAQALFGELFASRPDDEAVRFNLAWSQALGGDHAAAQQTLGDVAGTSLPQAAMLDLQLHHHRGEFDAAERKLDAYVERFSDYAPLQAAASVLAMDVDRADLARHCAERGGDHPEALATLGALELGERHLDRARALFAKSLEANGDNPRANIGYGLVELASGCTGAAPAYLDRGAEQFGDHLGSWLAAGWAHLIAGDDGTARARFQTALALDDSFGEAQGSLAVIDAMSGDRESARRRMEVALRLDRKSFAAALAGTILAAAEGDDDKARRIFEIAARQPLTHDGRTLADALADLAL